MAYTYKDNARYFNPVRRAILTYEMIQEGDRVAIGMSGGKDSTSLLTFLHELRIHQRLGYDFEILPILLDMGLPVDITPLNQYVSSLGYTLEIVPTNIMQVIFDIRKERSPCSLCAKLRRGILYSKAKELSANKVALGHHVDDALETYLMNFLLHGHMRAFEPMSYLSRTQLHLIRPMIYIQEKEIQRFVDRFSLPIIHNPCPVDKQTKRQEMKELVSHLAQTYPDIREKFAMAMENEQNVMWNPFA